MDAGLIVCSLSPVTQRKISTCLGRIFGLSKPLEDFNTVRDEILGRLLAAVSLIGAAQPSSQRANPEQHFRLGPFVEPIELGWAITLRPKLAKRFVRSF